MLKSDVRRSVCIGHPQSVGIVGQLTCGGQPAGDIEIKLWDKDWPDADDLLDEGKTNTNGKYALKGSTCEITQIDPIFNIYHKCQDADWQCRRKVNVYIPSRYITQGTTPSKMYDFGVFELGPKFADETRDCSDLD
ncbi:transthyretin-like family domain-containing protein [Ditylenchus destructor]|nr:transthyretin-like family domain-containing protein [Ditylenchus destructor]